MRRSKKDIIRLRSKGVMVLISFNFIMYSIMLLGFQPSSQFNIKLLIPFSMIAFSYAIFFYCLWTRVVVDYNNRRFIVYQINRKIVNFDEIESLSLYKREQIHINLNYKARVVIYCFACFPNRFRKEVLQKLNSAKENGVITRKKLNKKALIAISLILIISVIFFSAYGNRFNYSYELKEDGTYEITDIMIDWKTLRIPSTYRGKNVTSISYMFHSFNAEKIIISKNIDSLSSFFNTSLKEFVVSPANQYYSSYNGVLYDKNKRILIIYPSAKEVIEFSETTEIIGEFSFSNNSNIQEIEIPKSIYEIQGLAFTNCDDLESVIIRGNITTIGKGAFYNCNSLNSIIILGNVNNINALAFGNLYNLTSFTINSEIPPIISDNTFANSSDNLVIYVPIESINLYKNAEGWAHYEDRIFAIED